MTTFQSRIRAFARGGAVLVLVAGFLSACQSTLSGVGPIKLSPGVANELKTYMNEPKPAVFVVSKDGGTSTYYYCPSSGCRGLAAVYHKAITRCEKKSGGSSCHLLAEKKTIVWQENKGQPYTYEELIGESVALYPEDFEAHVGRGYISLSEQTTLNFQRFIDTYNSGVFDITADGKNSYSCFSQDCPNKSTTDPAIIKECEKQFGQKCYFFALQQHVVWKKTNSRR